MVLGKNNVIIVHYLIKLILHSFNKVNMYYITRHYCIYRDNLMYIF